MQQLNQQEFNNVLQELHFISFNQLENQWIEKVLVCGWAELTLKDLTYLDRDHPQWIPLAKLDVYYKKNNLAIDKIRCYSMLFRR